MIGCWTGCVVWALLPSMLLNLYIFGGIDFPNETVSLIWLIVGPTLLYGTLIAAPIIALLGVRRRDIGYPPLVAVLAIPIIIQVVAVALYVVLTDIYGAVCC